VYFNIFFCNGKVANKENEYAEYFKDSGSIIRNRTLEEAIHLFLLDPEDDGNRCLETWATILLSTRRNISEK
jgi:hypothetical protein